MSAAGWTINRCLLFCSVAFPTQEGDKQPSTSSSLLIVPSEDHKSSCYLFIIPPTHTHTTEFALKMNSFFTVLITLSYSGESSGPLHCQLQDRSAQ